VSEILVNANVSDTNVSDRRSYRVGSAIWQVSPIRPSRRRHQTRKLLRQLNPIVFIRV